MTGKQVTWSVNGLALLAGEACLRCGDGYGQETRALIAAERQRLREGLLELGQACRRAKRTSCCCGCPLRGVRRRCSSGWARAASSSAAARCTPALSRDTSA